MAIYETHHNTKQTNNQSELNHVYGTANTAQKKKLKTSLKRPTNTAISHIYSIKMHIIYRSDSLLFRDSAEQMQSVPYNKMNPEAHVPNYSKQ